MHARTYTRLLLTAFVVVLVDQVTKQIALDNYREPIDVIDGVLTLRLTFNPGGAFGLLQGLPGLFLVATIVAAGLILVWVRHLEQPSWVIPLGLVLGGGLGNLFDRVVRDTGGRVVDWIDLQVWPVFNLADSAIVVGVFLVLILGARAGSEESSGEAPADRG